MVGKITGWAAGILVALVIALVLLERAAAERVEVVVLHSKDAAGEVVDTRLWVVDYKGSAYLRVGADGSGWYARLLEHPAIELERGGEMHSYNATPRPELSEEINALMQEKYTWGDTFIGYLFGSRENSIPIQLVPAQ